MTLSYTAADYETGSAADGHETPVKPPGATQFGAQMRRVTERELAASVRAWLDGAEFDAQDACWRPYHGLNLQLRAEGDLLSHAGVVVLDRAKRQVIEWDGTPGGNSAALQDARAIGRYVLRRDLPRHGEPRRSLAPLPCADKITSLR